MQPNLQIEHKQLMSEAEGLLDLAEDHSRPLSVVEQQRFDTIAARLTTINNEALQKPVSFEQPNNIPDEAPVDAIGMRSRMPAFHANAKLQAFANTRDGNLSAYRSAQWLRASLLGDPKALNWCATNGIQVDVRASHSAGENAKGGVLVPEEFSATIIRLVDDYGVFRRNSRVVPMSADTLNIPRRTGGLTAHYVGENVEGTESDTAWDNVSLVAKKMMILSRMSSEIADDALISMADMLAMEAALAFALKEDTGGFNGTGSATDGGIVGVLVKAIDGNHGLARVAATAPHNILTEIDADDLLRLMSAIPAYAKSQSRWYCSPAALDVVFNAIKIAGGGNSFDNLANAPAPSFLGYPIELSPLFPDDPVADYNDIPMIAFGNLAQASTLGVRRELRFATTDSRYWEQDQIGIKATMRHDINVHDLGSATVKSPFAVLVGDAA